MNEFLLGFSVVMFLDYLRRIVKLLTRKPAVRVELRRGLSKRWYWRLRARNGEVLSYSELYDSKRNARQTAELMAKALGVKIDE